MEESRRGREREVIRDNNGEGWWNREEKEKERNKEE